MIIFQSLKLSDFDGKAQNCFTSIGIGPSIAFGGADGVIRVWNMHTWQLTHRLTTQGGHKSVQHIISYLVIFPVFLKSHEI